MSVRAERAAATWRSVDAANRRSVMMFDGCSVTVIIEWRVAKAAPCV